MSGNEESVLSPLPENRPVSRSNPRQFRNPPQPHMCIQDTLKGSQRLCFINIMSWCRIGIPPELSAPVPLYGGMTVPLNDRCAVSLSLDKMGQPKPLVFAVLVNPHVLSQNGKTANDPQERDRFIDLILDFIEAMNENIRFTRKFTLLKDRDLTGELKDIWTAIQVKREADKINCTTNQYILPDENCQPCSPRPICVRHKRAGGEGDSQQSVATMTDS